jgi:hypothetical protein
MRSGSLNFNVSDDIFKDVKLEGDLGLFACSNIVSFLKSWYVCTRM